MTYTAIFYRRQNRHIVHHIVRGILTTQQLIDTRNDLAREGWTFESLEEETPLP